MVSFSLIFPEVASNTKQSDVSSAKNPPYYNISEQNLQEKTVSDGAQLSSEGYSYVTEILPLPLSHPKHSNIQKKSDHHYSNQVENTGHQHNRIRRTQRRITHNEKRYHSGKNFSHS